MKWINGVIQQSAADTSAVLEISTSLGVIDQRTVWEILGCQILWDGIGGIAAEGGSYWLTWNLCATSDGANFGDPHEIMREMYQYYALAASDAAQDVKTVLDIRPIRETELIAPFLFAGSKLFMNLYSGGTGISNKVRFKLFYEEKKVTELEFLKIQAGYCVC